MSEHNQIWIVALFYTAIQGLVLFAVLLFIRRGRRLTNIILSAMMLWSTIHAVNSLLVATGLNVAVPWLLYVSMVLGPAVGPLYYFYTRSLLAPDYYPPPLLAAAFIFIPGLLYITPFVVSPIGLEEYASWFLRLRNGHTAPVDSTSVLLAISLVLYLATFLAVTWRYISRVKQDINDHFVSGARRHVTWLRILGMGFTVYVAVALVFLVKTIFTSEHSITERYLFSLLRSLIVQSTAISAFFLPEVFSTAVKELMIRKNKRLDDTVAEEYLERLIAHMKTDKPYRNPDLRLEDLARDLYITPHALSEVINSHLHIGFPDLINKYRVDEVCGRIRAGKSEQYTLLTIALDAGFSSKTSFYRAFRKHLGLSPSEYRDKTRKTGR